jgi:hypothetical protein
VRGLCAQEEVQAEETDIANSNATPASVSATICLPCGRILVVQGGAFIFRQPDSVPATIGRSWHAVFADGSHVVATGDGSQTLRYPDGSTCRKVDTCEHAVEDSDFQLKWISTTLDGKQVGLMLRHAVHKESKPSGDVEEEVLVPASRQLQQCSGAP